VAARTAATAFAFHSSATVAAAFAGASFVMAEDDPGSTAATIDAASAITK
jgi:hypothetical protein